MRYVLSSHFRITSNHNVTVRRHSNGKDILFMTNTREDTEANALPSTLTFDIKKGIHRIYWVFLPVAYLDSSKCLYLDLGIKLVHIFHTG